MQAFMNGSRLAFVVVPQEGEVVRKIDTWTKKKGLSANFVSQPAGYMVYFPRGHVIRCKNRSELRRYRLDGQPRVINIEGLSDPNSPFGKLMMAQDDQARQRGWDSMEQAVIKLCHAKSGKVEITKDVRELPQHEDLSHLED